MSISTHEILFFLCTNSVVGTSPGVYRYYSNRKAIIFSISSLALTIALSIIDYGIGITVFGTIIVEGMMTQLVILYIYWGTATIHGASRQGVYSSRCKSCQSKV